MYQRVQCNVVALLCVILTLQCLLVKSLPYCFKDHDICFTRPMVFICFDEKYKAMCKMNATCESQGMGALNLNGMDELYLEQNRSKKKRPRKEKKPKKVDIPKIEDDAIIFPSF